MSSNKNINARWVVKLRIRKGLLAAARARYRVRKTKANHDAIIMRRRQVTLAEKVLNRHPVAAHSISSKGVALISEFEGLSLKPYQDSVGVWTIGYGHTEGVTAHSKPLASKSAAEGLLKRDLDKKYAPYIAALRLPLNQNQFDALVSFVYNVGAGGVSSTTGVGRALRAHDWHAAADHLLDWDKAGGHTLAGLTRRRRAERALFLTK